MENIIIIAIVVVIIGLIGFYIYRTKKRGQKCIGCPYCNECPSLSKNTCCNNNNMSKK